MTPTSSEEGVLHVTFGSPQWQINVFPRGSRGFQEQYRMPSSPRQRIPCGFGVWAPFPLGTHFTRWSECAVTADKNSIPLTDITLWLDFHFMRYREFGNLKIKLECWQQRQQDYNLKNNFGYHFRCENIYLKCQQLTLCKGRFPHPGLLATPLYV